MEGSWSNGVPNRADQSNKYACKKWQSGMLPEQPVSVRIEAWRDKMLALQQMLEKLEVQAMQVQPV